MIPLAPTTVVRPVLAEDIPALQELVNRALAGAAYSLPMGEAEVQRQLLQPNPPGIYPVRWHDHGRLGAWRAGQLLGFLDVAIGRDSESLQQGDGRPLGLIRFLVLPERRELALEITDALLAAAHQYWRAARVGRVRAFHLSTGYPSFQMGAGILPGDWPEHFRTLTERGYRLLNRYYCLRRVMAQPVEEVTPMAELSLVQRGSPDNRTYHLYRRTDPIGGARLVCARFAAAPAPLLVGHMTELVIAPDWRGRGIGKWLLWRLINDATLQGVHEMVAFVAHNWGPAITLLAQQGFQELSYRGYAFEKDLDD